MNEEAIMDSPTIPFSFVVATGATTLVLASALTYALMGKKNVKR
jgi:hypothetical protein